MSENLKISVKMSVPTKSDFEFMNALGSGSYGQVFLAKKISEPMKNEKFAVKTILKSKNSKKVVANERKV